MPARRPYIPALLLVTDSELNIVHYNKVIESTAYINITVSNTVLGSKMCIKNTVLGSKSRAINQYLLIKKSIAPGPNSKSWGEIQYFIQQETM